MAGKGQNKRKDSDRVVLKTGECQRANGTYHYCWTDDCGKRHFIYAKTLEELREKEAQVERISTMESKQRLDMLPSMSCLNCGAKSNEA